MNLKPLLFLLLIFMPGVTENSVAQTILGKFAPISGKTMLFIGQDLGSIDGYVNSGKFPTPAGVTMYTDIYSMAGLNTTINYGAGDIGLQAALDRYPNSALSVGLWMVEEADGEGEVHPNGLIEIVNGFHDNELIKFRDFAKRNAPRPIFLRIGYEFDGPWNGYNPTRYIAAYKYIVDFLNAQGVTNVAYVWQSATWGENTGNIIDSYYPGDNYVDYVGLSFFFFNENFNGDNLEYILNFARNKDKPVMMAEVSAQYYEFDQGTFHPFDRPGSPQSLGGKGIWDQYFADQLIPFIDNNLDVIRAVAYINADWQSQPLWKWPDANAGFWGDTRIEKNNTISTNWSNYIDNGNFLHGGSNLLNDLGVVNNPTCNDGIQNQGETGIDCGGFNCAPCDTSGLCIGSDIPSVTVSITNETSQGANDGSIKFDFPNTAGRTNIEFSINNGSNYPYNVADNSGSTKVSNLSPGNYDLWVRWGNNECPQDLGGITIASGSNGDKDITAKLLPPNKKILLTIGQDLKTLHDYQQGGINSKGFPEMGGTATYIAFYSLLSSQFPQYGGLGETTNGSIARNGDGSTIDVDWGAGPLNSRSTILGYENSSLSIGLSMTEGENTANGVNYWCQGCLDQIGQGKWDNEIKRLAVFFKKYSNKAIYLRIAYEFDGNWNVGYEVRANYINAYRRIVDVLRAEGVTNVAFVWQSSASPVDDILDIRFGEGDFGDISSWYPGDSYVDWVGLSWFITADENSNMEPRIPTQRDKANEVVQFARSRNKPVYIAESTPQGYDLLNLNNCNISEVWDGTAASSCQSKTASQIWNEWYASFFEYIYVNKDVIRQVHYINTNWEDDTALFGQGNIENGYWGRAGVQINNTIANKWKNEINKSVWLHGSNSLNSTLLNSRSSEKANQSLGENVSIITSKPKISPNPSNDYIYIHTDNNQQINAVYILDINGRRINSIPKPIFKTSGDNMIDIRHLQQGTYFVTIKINQTTYIERLLINRL
ncbi:glycosyl hydrolase [Aquimarina latercula]|uniref:glycosyl hydrolase n=1 Tax=Aquimarina latercula TaxID=987 RepID=UPI000402D541|nr:glycosyl hydrolase [Aquimarina latercula]